MVRLALLLGGLRLFLDDVGKDGVVDGESIDVVKLFDEFEAHGAPDSSVPG